MSIFEYIDWWHDIDPVPEPPTEANYYEFNKEETCWRRAHGFEPGEPDMESVIDFAGEDENGRTLTPNHQGRSEAALC